ncbi:hypothetical protein B0J13DRAFT_531242 [Dactylonectria estremocensis]|uniref:BZIP domain-containing protein n=1 Tax=Dactylonectria estremocensis TaxID=1079267 RepID=A0A9P9DTG9_9HYPO|nr:hypothetical protein B0J13DRAFT_531242 [Dactylonectria estremocensis]
MHDEWNHVSERTERRRIQNRNAQRKFRQKVKETTEKEKRDYLNFTHAQNSYRIQDALEMVEESEVTGLPWGGINLRHIIAKGRQAQGTQSQRDAWPVFAETPWNSSNSDPHPDMESVALGLDTAGEFCIPPHLLTIHKAASASASNPERFRQDESQHSSSP